MVTVPSSHSRPYRPRMDSTSDGSTLSGILPMLFPISMKRAMASFDSDPGVFPLDSSIQNESLSFDMMSFNSSLLTMRVVFPSRL